MEALELILGRLELARERVGRVKAAVVITPKAERKPKYRQDPLKEA